VDYADLLATMITTTGMPAPAREHRFSPERRWRFDLAWPEVKLAVEVEGGVWQMGRHQRPVGFQNDVDKYNAAVLLGWRLLRVTPQMVQDGRALRLVEEVLRGRDGGAAPGAAGAGTGPGAA